MKCALTDLVYECAALSLSAHLAHFNVTGENFAPLHALYKDIYEFADEWFDTFGERVRQNGDPVESRSILAAPALPDGGDHIDYVYAAVEELKDCADEALKHIDPVTQNLVLEFMHGLQKFCWILESSSCDDE